ncbi:hypothetical protein XACW160_80210 [Xanthomonas citri pv. citri]|uniref:Uncharacterized protein n=1 Tax=Xanthomonas citri pv. citri TaxID=611301 RepID=A0A0U5BY17_XANCI|nr:hypothetical protein XAC1083_100211 [Xanthomonas citri pv. citri]CEE17805.1 hypothetical protein XAC902_100216 [Xanthomonas citri pv. citri]CEE28645.1 hypothetical protein XAC908_160018 [Xanthomonas citri pv. citri]CEE51200.1 hypothetical protein XACS584_110166 [Xanthomonas citri pv. citri]CEE54975.1 hypothetical protein XAC3608_130121 [Xanthomonas citri pv. citri]
MEGRCIPPETATTRSGCLTVMLGNLTQWGRRAVRQEDCGPTYWPRHASEPVRTAATEQRVPMLGLAFNEVKWCYFNNP